MLASQVYCLPEGYEVVDRSLDAIRSVLNPHFAPEQVRQKASPMLIASCSLQAFLSAHAVRHHDPALTDLLQIFLRNHDCRYRVVGIVQLCSGPSPIWRVQLVLGITS